jgi:hypothetical protein
MFHASVELEKAELGVGDVVTINHDFFGVYKQRRQAKIRELRPFFVAFGEHKCPEVPGSCGRRWRSAVGWSRSRPGARCWSG